MGVIDVRFRVAEVRKVPEQRPSVLLADDHPMVLEGLRKLLEPDFEVVGTAADGHALLEAAEACRPDLIIADIAMPELDGIEATRRLRESVPEARVLILSIHAEPSWVRAAFDAGANAYLTKAAGPAEIETAVREVLKGHFYVCPIVARAVVGMAAENPAQRLAREAHQALTHRELEIVRLVGTGIGNKEIARRLGVSLATVRTHLNNVYGKLGPANRVELALYAAQADGTLM
jgi:DNA-binding NarL/FixJ family response regulator